MGKIRLKMLEKAQDLMAAARALKAELTPQERAALKASRRLERKTRDR